MRIMLKNIILKKLLQSFLLIFLIPDQILRPQPEVFGHNFQIIEFNDSLAYLVKASGDRVINVGCESTLKMGLIASITAAVTVTFVFKGICSPICHSLRYLPMLIRQWDRKYASIQYLQTGYENISPTLHFACFSQNQNAVVQHFRNMQISDLSKHLSVALYPICFYHRTIFSSYILFFIFVTSSPFFF